jgi:hypothetical protein
MKELGLNTEQPSALYNFAMETYHPKNALKLLEHNVAEWEIKEEQLHYTRDHESLVGRGTNSKGIQVHIA